MSHVCWYNCDWAVLQMELERQRAVARDDQENLACENEDLHAKLEDLKNTTVSIPYVKQLYI